MSNDRENTAVDELQQEQMRKIVVKSFYKELINYGIQKKDIITISTYLLDCLMSDSIVRKDNEYYNTHFSINDINDEWDTDKRLKLQDVSITPLMPAVYTQVAGWLRNPSIKYSFIHLFPESERELKEYFEHSSRKYFCIYYNNEPIGVIGADNIDKDSKKLEMKKFIGNADLQGKGIGKLATFLFLYYSFCIMKFNKIYIHSGDTNIRNINLNSKFGFELEGMFIEDVYIRNERRDVVRMGLQKSRWMEIFLTPNPDKPEPIFAMRHEGSKKDR
jgi:RimJ/RimL family protein N-acetyltransferase